MNITFKIQEVPKLNLAFVSVKGVQHISSAYAKLMEWATPKGLIDDQTKMLSLYHNSFKDTEASQVKMSACILLHTSVETSGEIYETTINPGKCLVGSFEIGLEEFTTAWKYMFLWMKKNGYSKANKDPFEIYYNNFNEHPQKKAIVDFHIPIN